jgi:hypothetical protein
MESFFYLKIRLAVKPSNCFAQKDTSGRHLPCWSRTSKLICSMVVQKMAVLKWLKRNNFRQFEA